MNNFITDDLDNLTFPMYKEPNTRRSLSPMKIIALGVTGFVFLGFFAAAVVGGLAVAGGHFGALKGFYDAFNAIKIFHVLYEITIHITLMHLFHIFDRINCYTSHTNISYHSRVIRIVTNHKYHNISYKTAKLTNCETW